MPLGSFKVPAGFSSPAADHIEKQIFLDELLSICAPSVHLVKIDGDSMQGAVIFAGDLAVVDRANESAHDHIIVALLNNEPLCKRLVIRGKSLILKSESPKYPGHHIMERDEFSVWGVITYTVRSHLRYKLGVCLFGRTPEEVEKPE